MTELNILIPTMKPVTFKKHLTVYHKIQDITKGTRLINIELSNYNPNQFNYLMELSADLSLSYKRSILSLIIVLKRGYNLPIPVELRDYFQAIRSDITIQSATKLQEKELPTYSEIEEFIYSPKVMANPKQFIVNWLVFYIQTRNLDLLIKIVDKGDDISNTNCETSRRDYNYLIRNGKKPIKFIRNVYKTIETYGIKKNKIDNPIFIDILNQLPSGEFLIGDNPNTIGTKVSRQLYKTLSESEYLQININKYGADINKMKIIEKNRGTSLDTLLTAYNQLYSAEELK